jgi:intracellular sulfur oxidation DsrE/DsrF family protein
MSMQISRKIGIVLLGASLAAGTVLAQQSATSKRQPTYPAIAKYGKVVKFPRAPQQPRDGSKLVVDVTKGGEPGELNGAIEKVARFVNIYAGAGKEPASARIAVVLHGDATLSILKPEVYADRFETDGNPNLDCLNKLHQAGVEILVCGQALTSKGGKPEDVVELADVAVSGLTALVNLQQDGYSYVPLLK